MERIKMHNTLMRSQSSKGLNPREKFERTMKALFLVPKDEVKDETKRKIYKPRKAKG
jgi:hypothetical protein